MSHSERLGCDSLEDFLFGVLADGDARAFRDHCRTCEECREAVDAERRMKRHVAEAVRAAAGNRRQPARRPVITTAAPQPRLMTQPGVMAPPRVNTRQRVAAAIIALGVLAACLMTTPQPQPRREPIEVAHQRAPTDSVVASSLSPGRHRRTPAVVVQDGGVAVPLESHDPDVVVMLIYPSSRRIR